MTKYIQTRCLLFRYLTVMGLVWGTIKGSTDARRLYETSKRLIETTGIDYHIRNLVTDVMVSNRILLSAIACINHLSTLPRCVARVEDCRSLTVLLLFDIHLPILRSTSLSGEGHHFSAGAAHGRHQHQKHDFQKRLHMQFHVIKHVILFYLHKKLRSKYKETSNTQYLFL